MAATTTIRISGEAHELARSLARETGQSVRAIVDRAVDHYHGHWIIEQSNLAFERMHNDEPAETPVP
jgi:predicted DNA-binding protein